LNYGRLPLFFESWWLKLIKSEKLKFRASIKMTLTTLLCLASLILKGALRKIQFDLGKQKFCFMKIFNVFP
jgi:hypothetical protein